MARGRIKKRPLLLIVIALVLTIVIISFVFDEKPWHGLSCSEMLEFSASSKHMELSADGHIEFHEYYYKQCADYEGDV